MKKQTCHTWTKYVYIYIKSETEEEIIESDSDDNEAMESFPKAEFSSSPQQIKSYVHECWDGFSRPVPDRYLMPVK